VSLSMAYHHKDVDTRMLPWESPASTAGKRHNFASLESNEFGNVHAFLSWETMANRDVLTLTIGEGIRSPERTLICRE
jgi:hypothetical protein